MTIEELAAKIAELEGRAQAPRYVPLPRVGPHLDDPLGQKFHF